jgi:hypothetical protein
MLMEDIETIKEMITNKYVQRNFDGEIMEISGGERRSSNE